MQAPYFPLYSKDTLAEIGWMTNEEAGAWIRLRCQAWEQEPKGTLPGDDTLLMRFAQVHQSKWGEVKQAALYGFTLSEDGRYHNAALKAIYEEIKTSHLQKQKAADARWRKSSADAPHKQRISDASAEQCYSDADANSESDSNPKKRVAAATAHAREDSGEPVTGEVIANLQSKPAYRSLNVQHVADKMAFWCERKGKPATVDRLIGWLNGENPQNGNGASQKKSEADRNSGGQKKVVL